MSVYLVRRETKKGIRWHVRAELCDVSLGVEKVVTKKDGSTEIEHRLQLHLGSFESKELANVARDRALKDIAEGRPPRRFSIPAATEPTPTIADAAATWLPTLHDIADSTLVYYTRSAKTLPTWLASMRPEAVTFTHVQRFVGELADRYAPSTIPRELAVLAMILDNAGVTINPVRDKRVRLPRRQPKTYRLPSRAHIALLHAALPSRVELLTLLEHTGMRISEATALRWQDIDYTRDRLLVGVGKTLAAKRWIERLKESPPFPVIQTVSPDGNTGLVFPTPSPKSLTTTLAKLSITHGLPLYSAHDFRHLHASRLLHNGILSPAQIAARLGHANPGITLSTYSHIVPPD